MYSRKPARITIKSRIQEVTGLWEIDVAILHIFKDQPWLLRESGEMGYAAQSETHKLY